MIRFTYGNHLQLIVFIQIQRGIGNNDAQGPPLGEIVVATGERENEGGARRRSLPWPFPTALIIHNLQVKGADDPQSVEI